MIKKNTLPGNKSVTTLILITLALLLLFQAFPLIAQPETGFRPLKWNCLGSIQSIDHDNLKNNPLSSFGREGSFPFDEKTVSKILETSPELTLCNVAPNERGYIDLKKIFGERENRVAYSWTQFESPEKGYSILCLGSDDGCKHWLNGREVWYNPVYRSPAPDNDTFPVVLEKGLNRCVIKVDQGGGDWGFFLRFTGVMPVQKGIHLENVLENVPPVLLTDARYPLQQSIMVNIFNHGTRPAEHYRISCLSPLLMESLSPPVSCLPGKMIRVTVPLKLKSDAPSLPSVTLRLTGIEPDGKISDIGTVETKSIPAHTLLRKKTSHTSDDFFIVQITDCHILKMDSILLDVKTAENLKCAVEEINAMDPPPDFVVDTGDIVMDNLEAFRLYHEIVSKLKVPCIQAFGNHDKPEGLPKSHRVFSEWGLPPYYAFLHKGFWFITLDSVASVHPRYGKITEKQLEWLESVLGEKTEHPRLFFLHHDLFSGFGVKEYEKVQNLFHKYPGEKWVFTGHWHADCFVRRGEERHIITTSIGYQFDAERKLKHNRHTPGYRLIHFKKGKIVTRFKPLGQAAKDDPDIADWYTPEDVKRIYK